MDAQQLLTIHNYQAIIDNGQARLEREAERLNSCWIFCRREQDVDDVGAAAEEAGAHVEQLPGAGDRADRQAPVLAGSARRLADLADGVAHLRVVELAGDAAEDREDRRADEERIDPVDGGNGRAFSTAVGSSICTTTKVSLLAASR